MSSIAGRQDQGGRAAPLPSSDRPKPGLAAGRFRRRTAAAVGALLLGLSAAGVAVASQSLRLPPEKQAIAERTAAERAAAMAQQPPKRDTGPSPGTPQPTPSPRLGILDVQVSPFGSEAVVENRWQGHVDGALVEVYAGRLKSNPGQGFVGVVRSAAGQETSSARSLARSSQTPVAARSTFTTERYVTSDQTGALRITAAHGRQFILSAEHGPARVFDLLSGKPSATDVITIELPLQK